jgi:hypothetical protein
MVMAMTFKAPNEELALETREERNEYGIIMRLSRRVPGNA